MPIVPWQNSSGCRTWGVWGRCRCGCGRHDTAEQTWPTPAETRPPPQKQHVHCSPQTVLWRCTRTSHSLRESWSSIQCHIYPLIYIVHTHTHHLVNVRKWHNLYTNVYCICQICNTEISLMQELRIQYIISIPPKLLEMFHVNRNKQVVDSLGCSMGTHSILTSRFPGMVWSLLVFSALHTRTHTHTWIFHLLEAFTSKALITS